jgi:hypothetical protein
MGKPDEQKPDSGEAAAEKAPAHPSGEPPLQRWTLVPSVMPFERRTGPRNRAGGPESRQIAIAELLLVMTIVAVVLGVLRIVPEGYSRPALFAGFGLGWMVLSVLRPGRAVNQVALWVMLGLVTADAALGPDWANVRFLTCLLFLFYIALWTCPRKWRRAVSGQWLLDALDRPLAAYCLWWALFAICAVVLVELLVTAFDWTRVDVPWWFPLLLYGLATAAGLWRVLHSSRTESSQ